MKKFIFIIPIIFLLTGCRENSKGLESSSTFNSSFDSYSSDGLDEVNDDESYSDEEINRYEDVNGTQTVEACNSRTGSCYELEADISDGQVENIQFPNGGHLDLEGAELDESGQASGASYTHSEGYDGDEWEINCEDCE
jgi:hypothetical protein